MLDPESSSGTIGREPSERPPVWLRAAIAVVSVQVAVGVVGILAGVLSPNVALQRPERWLIHVVQVAAFAPAGVWLALRGLDRAARMFGLLLLAVGAFGFSYAGTRALVDAGIGGPALRALVAVPPDAFLPAILWTFLLYLAREGWGRRVVQCFHAAIAISVAIGVWLVYENVRFEYGLSDDPFNVKRSDNFTSAFWLWTYRPALAALLPLAIAPFVVGPQRRRQLALFLSVFLAAALLQGLHTVFSVANEVSFDTPGFGPTTLSFTMLVVVAIPIATVYTTLTFGALSVRVEGSAQARHGMARLALLALLSLPASAFGYFLFRQRDATIAELASDTRVTVPLVFGVLGFAAYLGRHTLARSLDRAFGRNRYDPARLVADVADRMRRSTDTHLAESLQEEVSRALEPGGCEVWLKSDDGKTLDSPDGSAHLPMEASVVRELAEADAPLEIEASQRADWPGASDFSLLVPIRGSRDQLLGALLLGERQGRLPFTPTDREALTAVASAASARIEAARQGDRHPTRAAMECAGCGRVEERGDACSVCGRPMAVAPVPHLLSGKFRMERRIGRGSMGVVYRARDESLGRPVAIKTLPVSDPRAAERLLQEAHVMARLSHQHLAAVYTTEWWDGAPLLVCELAARGTLADALAEGPLGTDGSLALGHALASALERAHAAGILHCDIKPSNIGFSDEGETKVLDFGLARILGAALGPETMGAVDPTAVAEPRRTTLMSGGLVGTPLYLSPETLALEPVDEAADIWAAAVVLFEAFAGHHPFERDSWPATMAAIRNGSSLTTGSFAEGIPKPVARLLCDALQPDRHERIATAQALADGLASAAAAL